MQITLINPESWIGKKAEGRKDDRPFRYKFIQSRCKEIHALLLRNEEYLHKMFSCSRENYTSSERNFCAFSLLEFVLKRLVSKRPVSGRTLLITQCRLLHRHHTTPPVVTMYRFCHTAKKSTEWAQNSNPTKLCLLNASADYRKYTPRRMRSWNSWRVMYRL